MGKYEDIQIEWRRIMHGRDEKWAYWRCLYAYVDARDNGILYLGKADRCTVRQRWNCASKDGLRDWAAELEIERIHLHVGMIEWGEGYRYSAEKLADVESLLIKRLRPPGNIMATRSRISRPGIRVLCGGNWPHRRGAFVDL